MQMRIGLLLVVVPVVGFIRFYPDGRLIWGYPVRFSFRATEGFGTLDISRTPGRQPATPTWGLRKIGCLSLTAAQAH